MSKIIAIGGNSGVGKTELAIALKGWYEQRNIQCLIYECDRYHKWERNDPNWLQFTHLNPDANNLEQMYTDILELKKGNNIWQIDYDHTVGKFTEQLYIVSKPIIIIIGLHTLYGKICELSEIKLFINTSENLRIKWKIERDIKRNYTLEKIIETINKRKTDSDLYIAPQIQNADIIINYN